MERAIACYGREHQRAPLATVHAPRDTRLSVRPLPVHGNTPAAVTPHHSLDCFHATPGEDEDIVQKKTSQSAQG